MQVHIIGADYQATLLQHIDADQLPAELGACNPATTPLTTPGGTCSCDPHCIGHAVDVALLPPPPPTPF